MDYHFGNQFLKLLEKLASIMLSQLVELRKKLLDFWELLWYTYGSYMKGMILITTLGMNRIRQGNKETKVQVTNGNKWSDNVTNHNCKR